MYNLISSKFKFSSALNVNDQGPLPMSRNDVNPLHRECGGPTEKSKVYNSVTELIGYTPLVKLNKIPKEYGVKCDIFVKCEYLNPGGSVKDRIALAMMNDLEKHQHIQEGTEFVEPTSGNTGIGIAMHAALRGYKCTIVTHEKCSDEKLCTMRLLGAQIIQIANNESEINMARKIKATDPKRILMLDQFENDVNPLTHYETTAREILSALGSVDMYVGGCGTGGTMTGVGTYLRENNPNCLIIAGDPDGSTMFSKKNGHPFLVEGIGGDEIPIVLNRDVVSQIIKVNDEEAFHMARELAGKEGILCGGSSGLAVIAAIKAIKEQRLCEGKRVVVLLPDGISNYMSKFVTDQWMEARLFKEPPQHTMKWWSEPVTALPLSKQYPAVDSSSSCEDVYSAMNEHHVSLAVVVEEGRYGKPSKFIGAVSRDSLRHYATNPTRMPGQSSEEFDFHDPVVRRLVKECYTLPQNWVKGVPTIGRLSRMLDITPFVVIGFDREDHGGDYFEAKGVATAEDVLKYIHDNSTY